MSTTFISVITHAGCISRGRGGRRRRGTEIRTERSSADDRGESGVWHVLAARRVAAVWVMRVPREGDRSALDVGCCALSLSNVVPQAVSHVRMSLAKRTPTYCFVAGDGRVALWRRIPHAPHTVLCGAARHLARGHTMRTAHVVVVTSRLTLKFKFWRQGDVRWHVKVCVTATEAAGLRAAKRRHGSELAALAAARIADRGQVTVGAVRGCVVPHELELVGQMADGRLALITVDVPLGLLGEPTLRVLRVNRQDVATVAGKLDAIPGGVESSEDLVVACALVPGVLHHGVALDKVKRDAVGHHGHAAAGERVQRL
mmetsp:Transcript_30751/g.69391  ORF Transcript_30751/g.69391 Transcript_30751/m.69391 type:complete len:315 (+) Transcript_30751:175-1119(+)